MICICCLDRCTFKKQLSGRVDYGFHCYMEICQFVYCLLSRTRELTDLPELNDWTAYMDSEKIKVFRKIDTASFLLNYEFGEELQRGSTGELKEFRNRCREFMDRLVDVLLENNLVSSDFLQGAYCFCPELLLEGDDRYVFQMFSKLVQVLERSGALSCEEAKSGTEEFMTFVVDARLRHAGSESSAENISDVVTYLLSDYSFLSRKNLCRIFKLCYLVIRRPTCDFPAVLISLNGCVVPDSVVSSCLRGVQSYVALRASRCSHCSRSTLWSAFGILFPRPVILWYPLPISTRGLVYVPVVALLLCSAIRSYSVLIWTRKRKPLINVSALLISVLGVVYPVLVRLT